MTDPTLSDGNARTFIGRALNRILGRSDITIAGQLYMRRWRLVHTRWFGIRVHQIVRSDNRDVHDHPFAFVSFILRGGYYENRPVHTRAFLEWRIAYRKELEPGDLDTTARWCGPGTLVFRRARDLHRLDLKCEQGGGDERPCWTLVFRGPTEHDWGFMPPTGWIGADEYKAQRHAWEEKAARAARGSY